MATLSVLLRSLLAACILALVKPDDTGIGFDDNISDQFSKLEQSLADRQKDLSLLARQIMLNRFYSADRVRSEGDSGLVSVRHAVSGSYDYHNDAFHEYEDFAALHDHASHKDLLGLGEIKAVINGVQFTTRHSDFNLVQPSSSSTTLHATEPIPPTAVPQSVSSKATVQEQVEEMIEYFRAFKEQNDTHRDYKPYFRPVLCYIEGYWLADYEKIENIPDSGDYLFQAVEWDDLASQAWLDSQTGAMYMATENTANLPRGIVGMNSAGMPVYGQWHYRPMCYPIREDIPTKYFRVVDDLSYRMPWHIDIDDLYYSRGARFTLDDLDKPGHYETENLLDRCVGQIPGLDNVPQYIKEEDYLRRNTLYSQTNDTILNIGYYNRYYYDSYRDPGRRNVHNRGFSDANVFVALNTQEKVAPMNISFRLKEADLRKYTNLRFSWMLPLEVIYRTPLAGWNPHGIKVVLGDADSAEATAVVDKESDENNPWAGVNEDNYLLTPKNFYSNKYPFTPRDSSRRSDDWFDFTWVNTTVGPNPAQVGASGLQRLTSPIQGNVGTVRLGYPIMPLHVSGNPVMKELSGLKTLLTEEMMKLAESLNQLAASSSKK